jgi:hypothetical protein
MTQSQRNAVPLNPLEHNRNQNGRCLKISALAHTQALYDTSHYICKKADAKVRGNLPPQLGRISQYSGTANQPL